MRRGRIVALYLRILFLMWMSCELLFYVIFLVFVSLVWFPCSGRGVLIVHILNWSTKEMYKAIIIFPHYESLEFQMWLLLPSNISFTSWLFCSHWLFLLNPSNLQYCSPLATCLLLEGRLSSCWLIMKYRKWLL